MYKGCFSSSSSAQNVAMLPDVSISSISPQNNDAIMPPDVSASSVIPQNNDRIEPSDAFLASVLSQNNDAIVPFDASASSFLPLTETFDASALSPSPPTNDTAQPFHQKKRSKSRMSGTGPTCTSHASTT
eukprot:10901526-Ditylum_brightwellii.AAC.1